jgi:putative ABC transport system substrate-binding protein
MTILIPTRKEEREAYVEAAVAMRQAARGAEARRPADAQRQVLVPGQFLALVVGQATTQRTMRCAFKTLCRGAAARSLDALIRRLPNVLRVILLAMLATLAMPLLSQGQQFKKIPRLCFLTFEPGTLQTRSPRFDVFFKTLRDLGYVDGQSINIDYLSADGRGERFPALVDECLRLKADVIVPSTTPAAQIAKKATNTIPIVMIALGDPLGTGLVDSLARPGGNVTGMSLMVPQLAAKRLELLKEAVPKISRALVLTYLADPIAPLQVNAMKEAAQRLGVTLQVHDIQTADELPAAFAAAVREGAEALIVTAESIFVTHRARVSELAYRHRLPAMYPFSIQVGDGGGLMAFDVVAPDLHRRAAMYVDQVLKGARPSDLPVQQPTKFELVINLKAAKALGLTIPPTFLARATEVIE